MCDDVEKDKKAFFYADVLFGGTRFDVFDDPVCELNEGELIHVTELVEAIGDAIQQISRPISTRTTGPGHVVRLEFFRLILRWGDGRWLGAGGGERDKEGLSWMGVYVRVSGLGRRIDWNEKRWMDFSCV